MCTYVRNGMLGRINRVECWHEENPIGGDIAKFGDPPDHLDWDRWLGPAQWKPYNPDYCHQKFRWMLDFGGGNIRDRGAHVFSVVNWFLDLDKTAPVRVTATGEPPPPGNLWDVPPTFRAVYEFEKPELTIVWEQPGKPAADATFGQVYHGTKGSSVFLGGDGNCGAEQEVLDYEPPANGVEVFRSRNHHKNFLDCMKTREKPIMDVEAGYKVAAMCILANLSYRLGRPLQWDPKKETIVGDKEAAALMSSPGRGPWHV
jgi:predicted dehydrogenase